MIASRGLAKRIHPAYSFAGVIHDFSSVLDYLVNIDIRRAHERSDLNCGSAMRRELLMEGGPVCHWSLPL